MPARVRQETDSAPGTLAEPGEPERRRDSPAQDLAAALAALGDALIATDAFARIAFMNPLAEVLTGWQREEAEGMLVYHVLKVTMPGTGDAPGLISRAIRAGERITLPPGAKVLEPRAREVTVSIHPLVGRRARVLGSILLFRDTAERRNLEKRVALTERLAAVATAAAGMAHEINNPLASILGNVEYAARRLRAIPRELGAALPSDQAGRALHDATEALADAELGGTRVRRLIKDLKTLARSDDAEPDSVELSEVIGAALSVTTHLLRSGVVVTTDVKRTPRVHFTESQLVQVLTNLVANAIEACAASPRRTVSIRSRTDDRGWAVVEVEDSGEGIRREDLARIFEPFFTTKRSADGWGLGLHICHSIIARGGGELSVESQLGEGATFRVALRPTEDTP